MLRNLSVGLIVMAALSASARGAQTADSRPNFLWITVEDLSPRLGAYGDPVARTPHLDRLAAQGTRYTNVFATAGVCAPSRSAIITGMYQTSIGTHQMRTTHPAPGLPTPYLAVPPPEVKTFTEYLRASGYYCSNNSKTDYQFGEPPTAWDESSTKAHWRNRRPGQPFFAVFNLMTTHESQVWPQPGRKLETDPLQVQLPSYYPDTPSVREDMARHYDNIARMDGQVARILTELEEDGLAGNTIVFFFSDHGDGLPRAKRWMYDSGLRVPMMIRGAGFGQGVVDDRLISFVDLAPTVLSLAGVPVPQHMQGRAFWGDSAQAPRTYVFGARDRIDESYDRVRAVSDGRYKLIRNYFPERPYILPVGYRDRGVIMQEILRLQQEGRLSGPPALWTSPVRPFEEFYDTASDPEEIRNLIDDPSWRPAAERLRRALDEWVRDTGDMGRIPEGWMAGAMWPGGLQPVTESPIFQPAEGIVDARGELTVSCPTPGSSIAWTWDDAPAGAYQLYSGPISIDRPGRVRAICVRYGYAVSPEAIVEFRLKP